MRETPEDLQRLQSLLDDTYARGGAHLTSIHTPEARLDSVELARRLAGMRVLVVATVTSDGRPLTGPVDSFLYRGRFHFSTAASSVRARHLAHRPWVSATHVQDEALVVTVHGRVRQLDLAGDDAGFLELGRDHYGPSWEEMMRSGAVAFSIEADRMLAADMSVHTQSA